MNVVELTMATLVFLGACSGAAEMGSASARAISESRERAQVLEQIEAQFLEVAPLLRAAASASSSCPEAAAAMLQQLQHGLPPAAAGLQRQLSLVPAGDQVVLAFSTPAGVGRQRRLSPAAYGWCPVAEAPAAQTVQQDLDQEVGHAAL